MRFHRIKVLLTIIAKHRNAFAALKQEDEAEYLSECTQCINCSYSMR